MKKSKLYVIPALLMLVMIFALCSIMVSADGMKEIDYYDISGMFEFGDDTIRCIAVAGDQMCVSEYYVSGDEPFVYQATTVLDGYSSAENNGALGLMLAVGDDPDLPIQRGCIIFRTPYNGGSGNIEMWTLSTEGALDYSFSKNTHLPLGVNEKRTYTMVYDGKGTFYGYADGKLYLKIPDTGFTGGYLGLLAWQSSGIYSDISVTKDLGSLDPEADWDALQAENEAKKKPVVVSSAEGGMDVIDFYDISGMFEIGDDTITCTAVAGDQMCVSEYYVSADEPFVYQATTNMSAYSESENNGGLGLMLSVGDDPDRPIQRGCIIFRTPYASGNTEIWTLSTEGAMDYSFNVNASNPIDVDMDRTYSLVYDGNGTFYGYADGDLYVTVPDSGFKGGYLGLLAWQSAGTYSDISISKDVSAYGIETAEAAPAEGGMDVIDFYDISGMFEFGDDTITCTAVAGDQMCVSEYYVSADAPFVYKATTNLTDYSSAENTGALGLMLSVGDDPDLPIQRGCIIFRTPYAGGNGNTEIWTLSTEGALDYSFSVNTPNPIEVGEDRTYALVYDGAGTFYGFADGELCVTVPDSGFKGGYLGLLAWQGAGTYSDISISGDISGYDLTASVKAEEPAAEEVVEVPATEEITEEPAAEEPTAEEPTEVTPTAEPIAPNTFDVTLFALLSVILSGLGLVVSKKEN